MTDGAKYGKSLRKWTIRGHNQQEIAQDKRELHGPQHHRGEHSQPTRSTNFDGTLGQRRHVQCGSDVMQAAGGQELDAISHVGKVGSTHKPAGADSHQKILNKDNDVGSTHCSKSGILEVRNNSFRRAVSSASKRLAVPVICTKMPGGMWLPYFSKGARKA